MKHRVFTSATIVLLLAACGGDGKITEPRGMPATPFAAIGTDPTTGATIETNKDDYLPGEIVHLEGRGWAPNETVHLFMTEDPDTHGDVSEDVVADSAGSFSLHFYDVQTHDYGAVFTLTATGGTSGSVVTVYFTDGRVVTSATINGVSPGATVNATAGQSLAFVVGGNTNGDAGTGNTHWESTSVTFTPQPSGTAIIVCNDVVVYTGSDPASGLSASFSAAAPAAGTYRVTFRAHQGPACNAGQQSAPFPGPAGPHLTLVVAASIGTTTTVGATPTPSVFGESVTFTATVTPASGPAATGTVNFYEFTGTQSCSALGTAVALGTATTAPFSFSTATLSVATHIITACYVPNAGWTASSGNVSHVVGKADVTVTVADDPASSTVGTSVKFTATVAAASPGAGIPTGTVTFYEFTGVQTCTAPGVATPLGSDGTAPYELSTSSLTAGNHTITACYGGDSNFNPGSGTDTHAVSLNATTTTIAGVPNPSVTGQTITFTASVKDAANAAVTAGTITFKVGGANCADAAAVLLAGPTALNPSGEAATTKAYKASESPKVIHACYSGTATHAASEGNVNQTIDKGSTQTVVTSTPASPSVFGQPVTFTATVTATGSAVGTPGGLVSFYDGGTSCASPGPQIGSAVSLNGSGQATSASATPSVGAHTILACYAESADFLGSSGTLPFTVDKASTNTYLASSGSPSVFGDPVTFTATVTVVAPGAGTPTGTVRFSVAGTCDPATGLISGGTALGTPQSLSGGSAAVSTSGLSAATHTIVACYGGDGNFNGSTKSISQVVNPKPTATTATVETATPQYSDKVKLKAVVTPHIVGTSELTGTVHFYVNGSVSCSPLPAGSVGSDVILAADDGVAELEYQILNAAGSYTVTACFVSSNTNFANSTDTEGLTLAKEDAAVAPGSTYGNAFSIGSATVAAFTLTFTVRETNPEPDANAGALPGDIDNTGLTVNLNAVGSSTNNKTLVCSPSAAIGTPPAYADVKTYTCNFTNVAVDAYEVDADVTGDYYVGGYLDALTVYDPNAGFVTGGGKFVYPDNSYDRVSFGLSFTFTGKGKTIPRGNLVVIRHLANGDVCRAKSNAIDAPAVVGKTASFTGKGNYGCVTPLGVAYDGIGNQTILGWLEDNGEGSNATAPDRFWINMNVPNSKLLISPAASSNARPLTGGNVQVPQPSSTR